MKSDRKLIASKLKIARQAMGLVQLDIARESKIPQSNVSAWEQGARTPPLHYFQWLITMNIDVTSLLDNRISDKEFYNICHNLTTPRCSSCAKKEEQIKDKDKYIADLHNSIASKDELIKYLKADYSQAGQAKAG